MNKKFFVAYRQDPLALLALELLKELGADGEPLDERACPDKSMTLLFTATSPEALHGKQHYCCSLERIQKYKVQIPTLGESAGAFVALKARDVGTLRLCQNRPQRILLQQALLGLDPQLVRQHKKPKRKKHRTRSRRDDYMLC